MNEWGGGVNVLPKLLGPSAAQMGIDFSSCLSAQPIQTGYHRTAREVSDCHRLQVSQALPDPAAGEEGVGWLPSGPLPRSTAPEGFPWPIRPMFSFLSGLARLLELPKDQTMLQPCSGYLEIPFSKFCQGVTCS